ncbi:hypothetical protein DVH24_013141 [Malus domestica]|uniref:Uncharacterized protein n=1 Tax=Malus domestica TaxID=3750 RepID=A0A498IKM6_MALDO|nr:hypothetical protein DVH24_013141 [Malus domestica]
MFHEEDSAYTTLRSEDFVNELSELVEDEEKIENSKLEVHLNEPTGQIATTNWSLPAKIHEFKDPFEVHYSNYGREFGIEQKIEVMQAQLNSIRMAKIWWKRQQKKMKKRKKSRALKLKKKQKYAVPHCLVLTPNFKATRRKKRKKKKMHGVVPHFNDPPSST